MICPINNCFLTNAQNHFLSYCRVGVEMGISSASYWLHIAWPVSSTAITGVRMECFARTPGLKREDCQATASLSTYKSKHVNIQSQFNVLLCFAWISEHATWWDGDSRQLWSIYRNICSTQKNERMRWVWAPSASVTNFCHDVKEWEFAPWRVPIFLSKTPRAVKRALAPYLVTYVNSRACST